MVNDKRQFYTIETLSEHMAESPEGFLYCYDVPVARTGDQVYKASEVPVEPNNQGLVTIKRDEKEVFNENTIKSFEGKPVTIDHPDDMVTPENWKDLAHGFVQNVRRGVREQADLLLGDIVITTKQAIELVKNGLRQVSCGYDAEYDQIEKGLGRQKDIIGNHIALVMRGRAGARCAIGDKECTHCEACKCKTNIQEDKMGIKKKFKDALMKALDAIPDDETDEEKKKAAEAKDAEAAKVEELKVLDRKAKDEETAKVEELKALDRKAKDQEEGMSEEDKEKKKAKDAEAAKVEELKALDSKAKDVEAAEAAKAVDQEEGEECNCIEELTSKITALEATIATMQKALEALVASDKEVHSSLDEEGARIEEGLEDKEKKAAKDCDSVWADIAYRAELLCPGIKLRKPTKDHAKSLAAIKAVALKAAFTSDKDIEPFVKGKNIDRLSGDTLDMAFVGASEVIRAKNNKSVRDSIFVKTSGAVSEVQMINKMNKEHWKK